MAQNGFETTETDRMDRLIALRDKFLRFLSARLHDKSAAEDVLQTAYIKAIEHGPEIRDDESAVAWFYRILRNALIDHYRRTAVRASGDAAYAEEIPLTYEPELTQTVCACIGDVVRDLKSDYRAAIEQVDLGGQSVEVFAKANSITPNNASVRLHRARKSVAQALTAACGSCAEHKCLDCTCRRSQRP
ncbi:MAG: sigma-70 family RNA polymerase sigma factor [Acidobacteriota bacterium]|nr:sigma-70 family RNA polymerase sigma factor [Acidobacteriota bacterium]